MLIVPAIDLRGGRCVRLMHGDPSRETRYDGDPVERARAFVAAGARRIHVVDLDGALGTGENIAAFGAICSAAGVPIQTGGGIRTMEDVRARFDAGASYVVLGTLLAEDPHVARSIIDVYGDRIYAGIDARGDHVKVRGWRTDAPMPRDAFVAEMYSWGVPRIVYTEIARDGAGTGYDVAALAHVAKLTPMSVTASGGAKTLDDLVALTAGTPPNVDHAIVGRALYEGTIDLAEAIFVASRNDDSQSRIA
jgi:phosphoribosylformimino-5-aminoimidazole carboxamide ribotide isomerase